MNQLPLVSVIIPTYNREKYLLQALNSVANQTYTNLEIIVVDDGSDINYAEKICEKIKNCKYYYKRNGGLSSARNYGVSKAKGEYIAFLDDDDYWRVDKLQIQVAVLNKKSSIDLVHSAAEVVDEKGLRVGKVIGAAQNKVNKRSGYVFWNALGVWVVKSPTPLIRKSVFKPDLLFDETIKVGEDIDFYQRLFYRHKVYYINKPLAFYREHAAIGRLSTQQEKYIGIEKKMYANFLKMGVYNVILKKRIAFKLLKSDLDRWNKIYPNNKRKYNLIKQLFLASKLLN
ncbi:glycosyltransferase family 2 protein [Lutibacter aestuarii]|uniref:Glycosyltransferase family 2 protein n=1 Tax=Lutibacter aestuarii TaxID=861111 RepID=A0ABW2Z5N2_9FLAO